MAQPPTSELYNDLEMGTPQNPKIESAEATHRQYLASGRGPECKGFPLISLMVRVQGGRCIGTSPYYPTRIQVLSH